MTLRQAIDEIIQDNPKSFTAADVIERMQGRPYYQRKIRDAGFGP